MISITFDSNVWRAIATPQRFPNDPDRASLDAIRQAIVDGRASAFLSETVFTLEAIQRTARKATIANNKPTIQFEERASDSGIAISFSIGPNTSAHPGTHPILQAHLQDAIALGFKLLRVPRIGGIVNPDLLPEYFAAETSDAMSARQERTGRILHEIEAQGCGMAHAKAVAGSHSASGPWHEGLSSLPAAEEHKFASAVAEWADGDSVAVHYGYENDVFCSRDIGRTGGNRSILAPVNRKWLHAEFGIVFATPREIAARL